MAHRDAAGHGRDQRLVRRPPTRLFEENAAAPPDWLVCTGVEPVRA